MKHLKIYEQFDENDPWGEEIVRNNDEIRPEIYFTIDCDGDIEYVTPMEYEDFVENLVNGGTIPVAERTEGTIYPDGRIVYRICTEVSEDWNDDVWEDNEVFI